MLEYYYETYNVNGQLYIKSVNAEIILQRKHTNQICISFSFLLA